MNFLQDLLDMTDEAETPKSFIYWAGLASISAIMKRRVWLDQFYIKVYPNIFVLLLADSGLRKGFAIKIVRDLVQGVNNTRVISGRNSIQSIIQELANAYIPGPGCLPIVESCAILVSDELSNLIINDPQSTTILHDLNDTSYTTNWTNTLKSGKEKLKDVYVTMFAATNESLYKDVIQAKDINGGFVGRTIVVSEKKRNRINPLTRPPKLLIDYEKLIHYLKSLALISGQFKYSPVGMSLFEEWYKELCEKNIEDKTGTVYRLNVHVVKVAMLLSLSRGTSLTLEEEDIAAAIEACTNLTVAVSRLTHREGKNPLAAQQERLLEILIEAKDKSYRVGRRAILRKMYGDLSSSDLDNIVETLEQAGVITKSRMNNEIMIGLSETVIKEVIERRDLIGNLTEKPKGKVERI